MDRRSFLRKAWASVACSAAAHPFMTTVTLASGAGILGEKRLIVVILRGAMDGLDVVQPLADPLFAPYRPGLGQNTGALDLDGFFALHPRLSGLMPLWAKGELAFVHATSTPYRDVRSHFDGQDLLEAGTGGALLAGQSREGWLNRMLQSIPGLVAETAYAFGNEAAPLLLGQAPVMNWSPELALNLSPQSQLLLEHLYRDDPLFDRSAQAALRLSEQMAALHLDEGQGRPASGVEPLVSFAANRLAQETRIAAFSLSGWDTHRAQQSHIQKPLAQLESLILGLRDSLGPKLWGQTALLTMTEFGRTARENGAGGTDHGTGGLMIAAGGAIRGGKVLGRWPGLEEAALYDRRDLMPTSDLRDWAAHALRGLFGLERNLLETRVFPGLILGDDPGLIW